MVINQGDVLYVDFGPPRGSAPAYRPAVVVQHGRFNRSTINTIVVVSVTSNLRLADLPGNVLLKGGEANLDRPSVANVTQISTLDRSAVLRKIGTLSRERLREIIAGIGTVIGAEVV